MVVEILYALILAAAGGGVGVAWYVHTHKRKQKPMVCPLRAHCETVVHSEFSRFLGIPLEWLGLVYYGGLFLSYAIFLFTPFTFPLGYLNILLTLSTLAFLFSLYLTFIQVFVLREYCSWCMLSASFSVIIFVSSFIAMADFVVPFLLLYKPAIVIIHLVGVALGSGGALISDLFFFKFLKDFRISVEENEILRTLSQIIWLALSILVVSGAALYLPAAAELNESGKFLVKVTVVGVVIVNGAILNLQVAPKLTQMTFRAAPGSPPESQSAVRLRRLAFALGAVSMTSWLTVLSVSTFPRGTPAVPILIVYGIILAGAIVTSQFVERKISKQLPLG